MYSPLLFTLKGLTLTAEIGTFLHRPGLTAVPHTFLSIHIHIRVLNLTTSTIATADIKELLLAAVVGVCVLMFVAGPSVAFCWTSKVLTSQGL